MAKTLSLRLLFTPLERVSRVSNCLGHRSTLELGRKMPGMCQGDS